MLLSAVLYAITGGALLWCYGCTEYLKLAEHGGVLWASSSQLYEDIAVSYPAVIGCFATILIIGTNFGARQGGGHRAASTKWLIIHGAISMITLLVISLCVAQYVYEG